MRVKLFRLAIGLGCAYEIMALPERSKLPTISTLIQRAQARHIGKAFLFGWLVGWSVHFVDPEHYRKNGAS